jgi:Methyltransferase domain
MGNTVKPSNFWRNPYRFAAPLRKFFRGRRLRGFRESYAECRTIVDVGGDHNLWDIVGRKEGVIVLNVWVPSDGGTLPYVIGDGRRLPFRDRSIDLAFSNSAIEHVGSFAEQSKFAAEMLRVGRKVYCQTPCRSFPIDPHLGAFFLHWLPRRFLTPGLMHYFTLYGWLLGGPYKYDVTWLSKARLRQMFPGCKINTERVLGLAKSFIVTSADGCSADRQS